MSVFPAAFEALLSDEGGWSDDPADRGGPTSRGGVTAPTLATAIARGIVPATTTLQNITRAQVMAIAETLYWRAAHCDEMPDALAFAVFDFAYISGPARAIESLQEALRVNADGLWGPKTAAAAKRAGDTDLVALTKIRLDFHEADIRANPPQARFGDGWEFRVLRTLVRAARA